MSEGPAKLRCSTNLKRAVYEWGTLAFGFLSATCLVFWIVSITSSVADVEPLALRYSLAVSATNGSLVANSRIDQTIEVLDDIVKDFGPGPPPPTDRGLDVPGFRCRVLRFHGDNAYYWAFEMSILIPFVVTGLLAGICFHRYRAACRPTISENPISLT